MRPTHSRQKSPHMNSVTWIGGRIRAPFLVDDPTAFRPDLILWLDATRDQLLVADVLEPAAPGCRR